MRLLLFYHSIQIRVLYTFAYKMAYVYMDVINVSQYTVKRKAVVIEQFAIYYLKHTRIRTYTRPFLSPPSTNVLHLTLTLKSAPTSACGS